MFWKFKMEILLKARELWGPIDGTEMKRQGDAAALLAYTKRENKALNFLVQSLFNNQLMMIVRKEKTAKGIWDTLAKCHVDQGLVNKILTRKFLMSQMGPTNTMEVHFNKLATMADELEAIEVTISDEVKVMVLLISLPNSYQSQITVLETFQLANWTWDVSTRLLNEELMKKETGESQEGEEVAVLMTKRSNSQCGKDWSKKIGANIVKNKVIRREIVRTRKTSDKRKNKGTMLIMEKLLHLFQPCLFLLMMTHGPSTLEHQCTFHTNKSGSRIWRKSHL